MPRQGEKVNSFALILLIQFLLRPTDRASRAYDSIMAERGHEISTGEFVGHGHSDWLFAEDHSCLAGRCASAVTRSDIPPLVSRESGRPRYQTCRPVPNGLPDSRVPRCSIEVRNTFLSWKRLEGVLTLPILFSQKEPSSHLHHYSPP